MLDLPTVFHGMFFILVCYNYKDLKPTPFISREHKANPDNKINYKKLKPKPKPGPAVDYKPKPGPAV